MTDRTIRALRRGVLRWGPGGGGGRRRSEQRTAQGGAGLNRRGPGAETACCGYPLGANRVPKFESPYPQSP